ncbi:MAG: protein-L-isoaspartate(D-aspartate) O-methyltransferase [Deltaproteobacteria bacterium]|nr:protein-L-isoaspartate(D-aspartate) O-methyltransferase [Deltaproteobacteria bacterium]
MQDFKKERLAMVEEQLRRRGIHDQRVLDVMAKIPRHFFVSHEHQHAAYEDRPLPIGEGQTISQPYMVAVMTQTLELYGDERVLEIGTGSGYQTAILAELAKTVFTIERIQTLIQGAQKTLQELGYENIFFLTGDGTKGWPENAPFNGIMVTAGAPEVPLTLTSQLAEGGRLVIPVGPRYTQTLYKVTRKGNQFKEEDITGCVFVPLVGDFGWKE